MDPYLERHWLDVHASLVTYSRDQLQGQLGDDLVARAEERLVVEDPFGPVRGMGPDLRIIEHGRPGAPAQRTSGAGLAQPISLLAESEPIHQRFLEIRAASTGGRVVTVIAFVSPSNKIAGDGREKYRQKQQECRGAGVNLVEIDLTRTGRRELLAHRRMRARQHESTYQASVWRASRPTACDLFPIHLRERLPVLPIPLRPTDDEIALDLQAIIDTAYESSRYGRTIDYSAPCDPPLDAEDLAWANTMLSARR